MMNLPTSTTLEDNLIWILLGLVLVLKVGAEMWLVRRKKDKDQERDEAIKSIVQETTETVLKKVLEEPPKNSVLAKIEGRLSVLTQEMITRLIRERPANQSFLDFQTSLPLLIKDIMRGVIPQLFKDITPGVLRDSIPCFRRDQTCGEAVRCLYEDQIRDTFRETARITLDNNVRLKDIQKRLPGDDRRATMPGIERQSR